MSQDTIGCSLRQIRNEVSNRVNPTLGDKHYDNKSLGRNRRIDNQNQKPSVKDRLGPVPNRSRGKHQ